MQKTLTNQVQCIKYSDCNVFLLLFRDNFKRQICTRTNKLHEFVSDGSIEEEYIHGNWIDTGMTISSPLSSHDILTVPKTYAQCTATVGP